MDDTFHPDPSAEQQPPLSNGGYLETPHSAQGGMFTANRLSNTAHEPPLTDPGTCRWTASPGYDRQPYGFRRHFPPSSPGLQSYGSPRLTQGYTFDPSVPPPPFSCPPLSCPPLSCPPLSQFSPPVSTGHPSSKAGPYCSSGPQSSEYDYQPRIGEQFRQQHEYPDLSERRGGPRFSSPSFLPRGEDSGQCAGHITDTRPVDEQSVQRRQDEQWVQERQDEQWVQRRPDEQWVQRRQDEQWVQGRQDEQSVQRRQDEQSVQRRQDEQSVQRRQDEQSVQRQDEQSVQRRQDEESVQRRQDEESVQRRQDEQFVKRFLQSRGSSSGRPESQQPPRSPVPQVADMLYGAAQLVSRLSSACEKLKHSLENESVWTEHYVTALCVKRELQEKLTVLNDFDGLNGLKNKLSRIAKRRARQRRRKLVRRMEDEDVERLMAEKEADIDKWRTKRIQEVEEKKMEREMKLAADSVLCEVRKKQADVRRMQDVLRSLEKLRKLRKEAASRKGIYPDQESDQAFYSRLEELRVVMRKRTAVYSAEEKALMVMLEGEQQEERKRDLEKRQKKERERHLQRKQEMDTMLFGDETPADPRLQPFREYFTQGEHSLPALVQIRREWDVFLVAVDHPDGAVVPQGWVLPDVPSDRAWASVLHSADAHPQLPD